MNLDGEGTSTENFSVSEQDGALGDADQTLSDEQPTLTEKQATERVRAEQSANDRRATLAEQRAEAAETRLTELQKIQDDKDEDEARGDTEALRSIRERRTARDEKAELDKGNAQLQADSAELAEIYVAQAADLRVEYAEELAEQTGVPVALLLKYGGETPDSMLGYVKDVQGDGVTAPALKFDSGRGKGAGTSIEGKTPQELIQMGLDKQKKR